MKITAFLRDRIWTRLYKVLKQDWVIKIIAVLLFILPAFVMIFSGMSPQQLSLRVDEVATKDIVSESNVVVVDYLKTKELQEQAAAQEQKIYKQDQAALLMAEHNIDSFFVELAEIGGKDGDSSAEEEVNSSAAQQAEERANQLRSYEELLNNLSEQNTSLFIDAEPLAYWLIDCSLEELELMQMESQRLTQAIMDRAITEEALDTLYAEISRQVGALDYSAEAKDVINLAVVSAVQPNLIYDEEATEEKIREAMAAVQPVQKTIKAGEIIVRSGERVSEEQLSILEQLGLQRSGGGRWFIALGVMLLLGILLWISIIYIRRYHNDIFQRPSKLLLLGLIITGILVISHLLDLIRISEVPEINSLTAYLAPMAAGSMLVAVLLNPRIAYFMTMIMSMLVGLMTNVNQLPVALVALVGSSIGIYYTSHIRQISDLAKSAIYIAAANVVTIISLMFLSGSPTWHVALIGIMMGAANGLLSAILMIGTLPYLESAFGVISMIRMMDLCNPNQPLLKRLLLEASGTYHHSIMVGNLAETTAEYIGANPLLVRVGAYYHDIGKINRPEYFVENQHGFLRNPHESIAPALSALIVTSHVKEGAELARSARLPEAVVDFIISHHGTSLVRYFYNMAVNEDGIQNINEKNFRYEGPKPRSKELALVMLADSVEAAVRSLSDNDQEKIRVTVRKIIEDKLNDGQLQECDLTFNDLDVIRNQFCKVLEGIYHKRIEYPEEVMRGMDDADRGSH